MLAAAAARTAVDDAARRLLPPPAAAAAAAAAAPPLCVFLMALWGTAKMVTLEINYRLSVPLQKPVCRQTRHTPDARGLGFSFYSVLSLILVVYRPVRHLECAAAPPAPVNFFSGL